LDADHPEMGVLFARRFTPKPTPVKSEAAGGGGLKGQTLQAWAWEETMVMR
jgi:hypothetical protein